MSAAIFAWIVLGGAWLGGVVVLVLVVRAVAPGNEMEQFGTPVETMVKTYPNLAMYQADARRMAADGWEARFGSRPWGRDRLSDVIRRPLGFLFGSFLVPFYRTVTWVREAPPR